MRLPSESKLTTGQVNGLRSFMDKTDDKKEYRRAVAILQKADGKIYDYLAHEHRVYIRTAKKWIGEYIKNDIHRKEESQIFHVYIATGGTLLIQEAYARCFQEWCYAPDEQRNCGFDVWS